MPFNPDEYLSQKNSGGGSFNPDDYLAEKGSVKNNEGPTYTTKSGEKVPIMAGFPIGPIGLLAAEAATAPNALEQVGSRLSAAIASAPKQLPQITKPQTVQEALSLKSDELPTYDKSLDSVISPNSKNVSAPEPPSGGGFLRKAGKFAGHKALDALGLGAAAKVLGLLK